MLILDPRLVFITFVTLLLIFPKNMMYVLLVFSMLATYLVHHIFFNLFTN